MLATVNPKTLLFVAAFLPQFVPTGAGPGALAALACVHVSVVLVGDLAWAASAGRARPALQSFGRLRHRLTGGLLIGAGVGLALARIER
jgi:threonine/homoserine/homoserine lactone efflux protein